MHAAAELGEIICLLQMIRSRHDDDVDTQSWSKILGADQTSFMYMRCVSRNIATITRLRILTYDAISIAAAIVQRTDKGRMICCQD